jgi:hypothetical protein
LQFRDENFPGLYGTSPRRSALRPEGAYNSAKPTPIIKPVKRIRKPTFKRGIQVSATGGAERRGDVPYKQGNQLH